jgi:DNA-binding MarR family transcriptional regulator
MLEPIIASNSQSAVLALLLAAPERSFTSKEIGSRLRLSEPVVTNSLNNFRKQNIVTSFTKGSQRYYLLNTKNKEVMDLRTAFLKQNRKYEDELFSAIKKLGQVQAAFLSGIFTGQPQLPVDILLVGKINLSKLDKFLTASRKLMGQDINYSIMSAEEFRLRRNTFDRFIKDIFDYRHLAVIDTVSQSKGKNKKGSNK